MPNPIRSKPAAINKHTYYEIEQKSTISHNKEDIMDEISKRVSELDEKIENYSNPQLDKDLEQQPYLPFDLPGDDQPMGLENYLKGLEYVSKEVEAQKK
jgi:hypothetical protein